MQQPRQPHTKTAATPLLAVWAVPDPAEVCRRLMEHYSDPGDLVLLPAHQKRIAARLRRRALALEPLLAAAGHSGDTGRTVSALPPPSAQLALVTLDRDAAQTDPAAVRVERLLAPGGFAVLNLSAESSPRLGDTVARLRASGLRYWQHLIVFDPAELDRRPHADLLVFHRPTAVAVTSRARRAA